MNNRFYDLNTYYRNIFGCRVQKITVDAGLNCPNRDGTISEHGCIYCNSKGSGTGAHTRGLSVSEQLSAGKTVLSRRYGAKKYIAYFQSFSNTYAPYEKLKNLYDEALSVEDMAGLSIGTRPDCVNEPVLNLLQNYSKDYLIWMEYGLQSVNDSTLMVINRGHDFECFRKAVELTKGRNIKICAHVILGLPGEGKSEMLETAKAVGDLQIDGIKIHLLYVVKGTKMEEMYLNGSFRCLEKEEYCGIVCDFLELLPEEMVIQRLTSDPHRDELVAPMWALEKAKTLSLIKNTLEKRDSRQGKFAF
ncbi:MAG: TIGR01212 family radical SAM protein [Desulfobacteraceae bacterium]|nr:MAG: TIGR01212 family radical SAM protein [Desulfobacteraceae bacterium]